jgi:GWxTD domain-containing protein
VDSALCCITGSPGVYFFKKWNEIMRCLLLFILILVQLPLAQEEYREIYPQDRRTTGNTQRIMPILFRAYPVATSENQYRLYLVADIMYDFMQFTLQGKEYRSECQIETFLKNKDSGKTFNKTWVSSLNLTNFDETNHRDKFFLMMDSLQVPTGPYELTVNYRDLQGEQKKKIDLKLHLPETKKFYASPPLFCVIGDSGADNFHAFPHRPLAMREHLPFNKKLGIYLNVWAAETDSAQIHLKIFNSENKKLIFQQDANAEIQDENARLFIQPPFIQWNEGKYNLKITYMSDSYSFKQNLNFQIVWFDKPRSLRDPDYAIQPLKLVMSEAQYDKLTSGGRKEENQAFREYWKEKDPTTGTAYNEVLAEFYTRVDSADIYWGRGDRRFGWRTDPGRIYVIYGEPDKIEDYSLAPSNPHMVWIYHLADRNLTFLFKSLDGRKRYRLVNEQEETLQ